MSQPVGPTAFVAHVEKLSTFELSLLGYMKSTSHVVFLCGGCGGLVVVSDC